MGVMGDNEKLSGADSAFPENTRVSSEGHFVQSHLRPITTTIIDNSLISVSAWILHLEKQLTTPGMIIPPELAPAVSIKEVEHAKKEVVSSCIAPSRVEPTPFFGVARSLVSIYVGKL